MEAQNSLNKLSNSVELRAQSVAWWQATMQLISLHSPLIVNPFDIPNETLPPPTFQWACSLFSGLEFLQINLNGQSGMYRSFTQQNLDTICSVNLDCFSDSGVRLSSQGSFGQSHPQIFKPHQKRTTALGCRSSYGLLFSCNQTNTDMRTASQGSTAQDATSFFAQNNK